MPSSNIFSLAQGSSNITVSSDGISLMSLNTRQILLNETTYDKITIDFGDGYKVYLTNFSEAYGGSTGSSNVLGVPFTPSSPGVHTVNVIPGRLYMSRFDIYDANSGSLLGGYLMPSAMYPMTTREPAITLEESGGNLVISNYQSYGYARASIQATGTFFMIGGAVETPWRSYSNLTYLSNIPTANSSTIDTIVVAGGEALTVSNVTDHSILFNASGSLTFTGALNARGAVPQTSPITAEDVSSVAGSQMHVSQDTIKQFIHAFQSPESFTQGYNYYYLTDFQSQSNFGVHSNNNALTLNNFLSIGSNNLYQQNVDLSNYQGIVLVGSGIDVTEIGQNTQLGLLGGGTYHLGSGNQTIAIMGPNGVVIGGEGLDTVRMLGVTRDSANFSQQNADVSIWSGWVDTGTGVTHLNNIDRVLFDDGSVAYDTGAGQNAGAVARLYQAVFQRTGDQGGLGFWIQQLDDGASLMSVAQAFIQSPEFINRFGEDISNSQYISSLYNDVLGRAADSDGALFWLTALQNGLSRADILISFSESEEHVLRTSNLLANGIEYEQFIAQ